MLKVGVWGPGSMGTIALRGVIDHPQLQLVDVVVHSDAKSGVDAGRLCGIDPVGVMVTQDPAALLAADADVVVYAAAANLRPLEAVQDMASLLRAGKNVVSCSVVPLVFPDAVDAAFTGPLRAAALDGNASFFTTGIDTGFANDVLPLTLTGVSRVIDTVRVTEMFNYATYPDRVAVYEILGFGKPPEFTAIAAMPGVFTFGWGPVLHQLATGLGVQIDHLDESVERVAADEPFDTPTGHIKAGTVWPQPHTSISPRDLGYGAASGRGVYRVEIDGSPSIRCELELADDHDHDLGARVAGASRMVNVIPAVHAAPPGLLSALDLPVVTGAGLVRPVPGPPPDSRLLHTPSNGRVDT
jgi:4-hydroxy-tetrahydrodipicolinate reductase